MKNILTIFKKEWDRVIKDKRLVLTVMILPGLMIFLIYTFIGSAMQGMFTADSYYIAIVNPEPGFELIYEAGEIAATTEYEDGEIAITGNLDHLNVITITADQVDTYKEKIDNEEWSLLIILEEDIVNFYHSDSYVDGDKPIIYTYYNPNSVEDDTIVSRFNSYLEIYGNQLSYMEFGDSEFFTQASENTPIDESSMAGILLSGLLPMLIIMFLFSGAMSIGPESIAGEKERGTIATLLVTPVKRSEIALGKVLGLSVLTLLSACSSFIGIMASLPKMLSWGDVDPTDFYGASDYLMILVVMMSTVFIAVGIISIISAYAKNLKEAGTLIAPVYLITIIVAVTSAFGSSANTNLFMYLLPIYNTSQTLIAILQFDPNVLTYLLITVAANLVFLAIFVFVLNKMFKSENIMFAK